MKLLGALSAWRCCSMLLFITVYAKRASALFAVAEEEPFEYEGGDSYYYYYEEEPTTKEAAQPKQKVKPSPAQLKRTSSSNEASVMASGFTRMPREGETDEEEENKVTPLWDEGYLMEVKQAYGCILHDEKLQLDDELFGFEVELTDHERLKQDRMMRIRRDREREWNRKESAKLPGQQQGGGDEAPEDGAGEGGAPLLDENGNPVAAAAAKAKYSDTVEVATAQSLGADCQTLLCSSCHVVVEEFAAALALASRRQAGVVAALPPGAVAPPLYVEGVFDDAFCASKPFTHRYSDLVADVCRKFDDALGGSRPVPTKIADPRLQHLASKFHKVKEGYGYGEILFKFFEGAIGSAEGFDTWAERVTSQGFLSLAKRSVCRAITACNGTDFAPVQTRQRQERWTVSCHVCQALAADLEARLQLLRRLESETDVVDAVRRTCDRLALAPEHDALCRQIVADMEAQEGGERSLDEVAWMAKLHGESLTAKRERNPLAKTAIKIGKGKGFYPDKLCEALQVCQKWETAADLHKKKVNKEIDAVFF